MMTGYEHAIESAVADIILLGNDRQVELANAFSKAFADDGHADTSALLEALRADLRKELLAATPAHVDRGYPSSPARSGPRSLRGSALGSLGAMKHCRVRDSTKV